MTKVKIKGKTYSYADFLARMKGKNPEWVRSKKQKVIDKIKRGESASFYNIKTKENMTLGDGLIGVTHVHSNIQKHYKVFKNRQKAKDYVLKRLKKNRSSLK